MFYNCSSTLELLDGTGLSCPPVLGYLPRLVDFAQALLRSEEKAIGVEDSLDTAPPAR